MNEQNTEKIKNSLEKKTTNRPRVCSLNFQPHPYYLQKIWLGRQRKIMAFSGTKISKLFYVKTLPRDGT